MATGRCTRFRMDGARCENATDHADGWCREPECPGYLRRSTAGAPTVEDVAPPVPTPARAAVPRPPRVRPTRPGQGSGRPTEGVDLGQLDELRITQKAVDCFLFHHGGDRQTAETELRMMVEDFSLRGSGRQRRGYLTLSHQGFQVVISPDRDAVVEYSTIHRERTWSQVKQRVVSRFQVERHALRWDGGADPVVLDPPSGVLDLLDIATIELAPAVRSQALSLMRRNGIDGDRAEFARALLRSDLAAAPSVERGSSGVHVIHGYTATWVVSPGLRTLVSLRPARAGRIGPDEPGREP